MTNEELEQSIIRYTDSFESITAAMIEMQDIYGQRLPYAKILKTYGICYRWSKIFIDGVLLAMSTDRLDQFSEDELKAWYSFVMFQDYHSHSALDTDCNTVAVGCTIPNSEFKSFVVCEDGTITTTECQYPRYDVMSEEIWKSLDRALLAVYNCEPIDDCGISDEWFQKYLCGQNSCPIQDDTTIPVYDPCAKPKQTITRK